MAKGAKKAGTKRRAKHSKRSSAARIGPDGVDLGTDKLYFKIGEVAEIVEVAAHVLRYWETEFTIVKPRKSRSQQRVYRRKDVENLLRIKHLLYERKFTIAGARQELRGGASKVEPARVSGAYRARQSIVHVREQLDRLGAAIRSDPGPSELAADPAAFVRSAGGAAGLLEARGGGPSQQLVERPRRGPSETR